MNSQKHLFIVVALLGVAFTMQLHAQPTAFTYQGQLSESDSPASGFYDLTFTLYDSSAGVSVVGGPITNAATVVANGLFTVMLDFGSGVFDGAERWLEIAVATNGGGAFMPLTPRQQISSAPYAVKAADAMAVDMGMVTDPTFIGTTTTSPLELAVNNQGAFRLENTVGTPNIVGGVAANNVSSGIQGATIAGGGLATFPNRVTENWGSIGGGTYNLVSGEWAAIGGGRDNRALSDYAAVAGGFANYVDTNATAAAVSGGQGNRVTGQHSTIAGGILNTNTGLGASIGGGNRNSTAANDTVIAGGTHNRIDVESIQSSIGGGGYNVIGSNTMYASIAGGENNLASRQWASITGGRNNIASGDYATVAGGVGNMANGQGSLAAGNGAQAIHDGTFVWADSTGADFTSTSGNQFNVRASGGVRLETSGAGMTLDGAGVLAGLVPSAALSGTYSSPVIFNNVANSFSGNGANLTSLNASQLTTGTVPSDRIAGGYSSPVSFANLANTLFGKFYGNQSDSAASPAHTWSAEDSDTGMFRAANNTLGLSTGGTERMRITDSGLVGIGTTSPAAPLHVIGGTDTSVTGGGHLVLGNTNSISLSMDGNEIMARSNDAYSILFLNADGGNVSIGTASPDTTYTLRVNGSVAGVGAYNNISDERYKKNVRELDGALDAVLHMRGVSFDWRHDEYPGMKFEDRRQLGFVAQELAEVLPEAVSLDTQGTLSIAYTKVVPVLVEAIKEQNQQSQVSIQELKSENALLRDELQELKQLVAKLTEKGTNP